MKFIELTGAQLVHVLKPDEMNAADFDNAGLTDQTIVRINEQGDIEIRRANGWDLVGGLLGDFAQRIRQSTGLDWA